MTVLVLPPPSTGGVVPCTYCRALIPADSFVDLSPTRRLVRGTCPGCARTVTMSRLTLLRLSRPPRLKQFSLSREMAPE
jgi:hypothetical protein